MVLIGRPCRNLDADQRGGGRREVGATVHGITQHGDAIADQSQGELEGEQPSRGHEGDGGYSYGGLVHLTLGRLNTKTQRH
jgi:hypothetical protein